jgi:TolB-like protein
MNVGRLVAFALAALAPALASGQVGASARKVRVAVMEIRPLGTEATKAELLSEVALTEASSMPGFDVIGRSDITSLIGFEKQKQVMGCAEDSTCLAEIGGALGVDFILVGSLGRIGNLYRLDVKLVDTRKARVRNRLGVTVEGAEEKLVAAIQKAIRDLLKPETPPAAEPVASKDAEKSKPRLDVRPAKTESSASRAPIPADPGEAGVTAYAGTSSRRKWSYVSGGVGLALVAGGAVAGLAARSALDEEKAAASVGDAKAYEDNKSRAKTMSAVADGLFLGGSVGVGVGTWLFFTSRPPPVTLGVAPTAGGAFATISGGF